MVEEGMLDDALARAWLAHDQAESPLLAVDFEGLEDVLLMRQQRRLAGEIERMMFQAEV